MEFELHIEMLINGEHEVLNLGPIHVMELKGYIERLMLSEHRPELDQHITQFCVIPVV